MKENIRKIKIDETTYSKCSREEGVMLTKKAFSVFLERIIFHKF